MRRRSKIFPQEQRGKSASPATRRNCTSGSYIRNSTKSRSLAVNRFRMTICLSWALWVLRDGARRNGKSGGGGWCRLWSIVFRFRGTRRFGGAFGSVVRRVHMDLMGGGLFFKRYNSIEIFHGKALQRA